MGFSDSIMFKEAMRKEFDAVSPAVAFILCLFDKDAVVEGRDEERSGTALDSDGAKEMFALLDKWGVTEEDIAAAVSKAKFVPQGRRRGYKSHLPHPIKDRVREYIFEDTKRWGKVLLLPSSTCADVKAGIKAGVIDTHTEVHAYEKVLSVARKISLTLQTLHIPATVKRSNIEYCANEILASHSQRRFDFMYFDFCGAWLPKTQDFFEVIRPIDCPMAFTFSQPRGGTTWKEDEINKDINWGFLKELPGLIQPEYVNYSSTPQTLKQFYWTLWNILKVRRVSFKEVKRFVIYKEDKRGTREPKPMMFCIINPRPKKEKKP